jgi:glycyl-tRNA synthetase alpha subunit
VLELLATFITEKLWLLLMHYCVRIEITSGLKRFITLLTGKSSLTAVCFKMSGQKIPYFEIFIAAWLCAEEYCIVVTRKLVICEAA